MEHFFKNALINERTLLNIFNFSSVEGKVKAAAGIRAGVVHARLMFGEYRGSDLGALLNEAASMALKEDAKEHIYILKGMLHTFEQQVNTATQFC